MNQYTLGHLYAVTAFAFWGLIPMYWKELGHISPMGLLGHRIAWGFLTFIILFAFLKKNPLRILKKMEKDKLIILSTTLIALNWFTFVYAVKTGKIVESSLGYFLNPLLNVLLGVLLFSERINFTKGISLILAFIGVLLFSKGRTGSLWISLTLAFSFAFYGVVHKKSTLKGLEGLFCEITLLSIFLLPLLFYTGTIHTDHILGEKGLLIFLSGVVTISPLILFTLSVKRIPYTNIGLIQYLAPLGQFALGVLLYKEPFTSTTLIAFFLIWAALFIFSFGEVFKLKLKKEKKT